MEETSRANRSLSEEAARERTYWKKNHLWTILVFAVLIVYTFLTGSDMSVSPGTDAVNVTMPDGSTMTVPYTEITDAQLIEDPDYGECVDGENARKWKSGVWKNEAWGEYTLCVYTSSDSCVLLTTEEGSLAVNLASDSDTAQLYDIILENSPAN